MSTALLSPEKSGLTEDQKSLVIDARDRAMGKNPNKPLYEICNEISAQIGAFPRQVRDFLRKLNGSNNEGRKTLRRQKRPGFTRRNHIRSG